MKIEVKTKDDYFIIVNDVKEAVHFDGGYHFLDGEGKTLLCVPTENLWYYKKI